MKLSIIIPCYNEKLFIEKIVDRVRALTIEKEIIIVDDGSTDGTRDILPLLDGKVDKIIYKEKNEGKGSAIRTGLQYVTGDAIVIQDGDLEYDPRDLQKMLHHMVYEQATVVYGSRVLSKSAHSSFSFYIGGRFLSWLVNFLYGAKITDEPTCYKMFRKDVLQGILLQCEGFEFCPEVTAKVLRLGHSIEELPISYHPRSKTEGKKINWRDGIVAIWYLVKLRFTSKKKFLKKAG